MTKSCIMIVIPGFRNFEMHSTLKSIQALEKGVGRRNITNCYNWHSPWYRKHTSLIIGILLATRSNKM
jgi:hypothetical protein